MKKFLYASLALSLMLSTTAQAAVGVFAQNIAWYSAPSTIANVFSGYCVTGNLVYDVDAHTYASLQDCDGTPYTLPVWPVATADVTGLTTALAGKMAVPTGTLSDYLAGNGTVQSFPTNLNAFTNGPAFITSSSLSGYLLNSTAASTYLSIGTASSTYFPIPTGTTAQYLRGNGTLATFPAIPTLTSQLTNDSGFLTSLGSRTFNYPSRTKDSCFQVSSTKDADVNYSVNISATLTLGGGTGVLTSYTNSGCSTGTQVLAQGAVSSVALLGTSSIPLHAVAKANTWLKVTATATGGGTAAIDSVQAETILP